MREFLLKMYAYLKKLPQEQGLYAAVAVTLAMLGKGDYLAVQDRLLPGGILPGKLSASLLDRGTDPAQAVGAAMAMRARGEGCVVAVPVPVECAQEERFAQLLELAQALCLPILFLLECSEEFPEELESEAALGEMERIQADGTDAMRLMPALRLAIDRAREGDGPTLVECMLNIDEEDEGRSPAERLKDVLLTEGFARPEELA